LEKLVQTKDEEIKNHEKRNKGQEDREKKLKKELDEVKALMLKAQKNFNDNLEEMKRRL
jgi:hypothetical protein